jgi:hypothetical protein
MSQFQSLITSQLITSTYTTDTCTNPHFRGCNDHKIFLSVGKSIGEKYKSDRHDWKSSLSVAPSGITSMEQWADVCSAAVPEDQHGESALFNYCFPFSLSFSLMFSLEFSAHHASVIFVHKFIFLLIFFMLSFFKLIIFKILVLATLKRKKIKLSIAINYSSRCNFLFDCLKFIRTGGKNRN